MAGEPRDCSAVHLHGAKAACKGPHTPSYQDQDGPSQSNCVIQVINMWASYAAKCMQLHAVILWYMLFHVVSTCYMMLLHDVATWYCMMFHDVHDWFIYGVHDSFMMLHVVLPTVHNFASICVFRMMERALMITERSELEHPALALDMGSRAGDG